MRLLSIAIAVSLVAATTPSALSQNNDVEKNRIVVSGQGEASGAPDIATIQVGVVSEAESANQAVEANNEKMKALTQSLKDDGIEDKDLQTSRFSISPVYERPDGRGGSSKIVRYRVSNQLEVRIRKLDGLGDLLDQVVQSGANQIQGISFEISNTDQLLDQALTNAIADARRKAEVMCSKAGVELGSVVEIRESMDGPRPVQMRQMAMADAGSVPVQPGEQTVSAGVQMTFQLNAK